MVTRSGIMIPAAAPWTTRKTIRLSMFQATPDRAEPTTKSTRERIQRRFAPRRWVAQPVTGMAIAMARR
jgi:hypothetical protein